MDAIDDLELETDFPLSIVTQEDIEEQRLILTMMHNPHLPNFIEFNSFTDKDYL